MVTTNIVELAGTRIEIYDTPDRRLADRGLQLSHRIEYRPDGGTWLLEGPDGWRMSWAGDRLDMPEEVSRILRGVVRRSTLQAVPEDPSEVGDTSPLAEPPPLRAEPAHLDRKSSLSEVVRFGLTAGVGRLLDHDYKLRLDPVSAPARDIHQARVATRRLRSNLKTFRSLLDPIWLDHTRAELRWLGLELGSVRDLDVLAARLRTDGGLDESTVGRAARQRLDAQLLAQRQAAASELAHDLDSARYLDLLDRLHAASDRPPFATNAAGMTEMLARTVLPHLVRRPYRTWRKVVREAGDEPANADLHRIRIKAKEVRYASELSAPVIGKPAVRTAKAAERLQTVLGDHRDTVAVEDWLRREGARHPEVCFTAGQLSAEQAREQRKLRSRWRSVSHKLEKKARRKWMR